MQHFCGTWLHEGGQGDLPRSGVLPAQALFWKVLCRTLSAFMLSSSPRNILQLPGLANRCCSILCSCQRGSGRSVGLDQGHCYSLLHATSRAAFLDSDGFLGAELQSCSSGRLTWLCLMRRKDSSAPRARVLAQYQLKARPAPSYF
jgi:hypothetical protein